MHRDRLRELLGAAFDAGRSGIERETYLDAVLVDPIPWPAMNPAMVRCQVHDGMVTREEVCRHMVCRRCPHPRHIVD